MNIENKAIREFRIKMAALLILRKVLLGGNCVGTSLGYGGHCLACRRGNAPLDATCRWNRADTCPSLGGRGGTASTSGANCRASESRQTKCFRRIDDGSGNHKSWQLEESVVAAAHTTSALAWKDLLGALCRCSCVRMHQLSHP